MGRLRTIGIDVDVHRIIEQARQSFAETENDILRRLLNAKGVAREPESGIAPAPRIALPTASRTRGLWCVRIGDGRIPAANLKDAYRALLLQLSAMSDDFLPAFANEKARSRRFIARRPEELYLSSPHLAKAYAAPLTNGWYFDSNLSGEQVASRARVAARIAGLRYGQDVSIMENLREI
nr:hypothetical protein [uncultured Sphingomonas sp.]